MNRLQSFVREIHSNDEVREITQTIIGMAKRLRLDVIAEGVETKSQVSFLGENGCDELQGFYFGYPLPAGEIGTVLHGGRVLRTEQAVDQIVRADV